MVYVQKHAILQHMVPSGHTWLVPLRPYSLFHWPIIDSWPLLTPKHPPCFTSEITEQYWHCEVLAVFNCSCRKALIICNWSKRKLIQGHSFHMRHFDAVDISDHSSCGNEVQLSVFLLSHNYMHQLEMDLKALYSMPPWPHKML